MYQPDEDDESKHEMSEGDDMSDDDDEDERTNVKNEVKSDDEEGQGMEVNKDKEVFFGEDGDDDDQMWGI